MDLENIHSPEKLLQKESFHLTEHMDDIGNLSSAPNIGLQLSKYDNFLGKKDIISPSKHVDQKKRIIESLNENLLDVFDEVLEIVENKEKIIDAMFKIEKDEDWELLRKEEFTTKSFFIQINRKIQTKGRFFMSFEDKNAEELFEEFLDPGNKIIWDKSLLFREHKYGKSSKEIAVHQIYKPCDILDKYKEVQFLRYNNRFKKTYFILGKTEQNKENAWYKDDEKIPKNQKVQGSINKLLITVFNYSRNQKNYSCIFYEIDVLFDCSQINRLSSGLNKLLLFNYLDNFKLLHNLICPNGSILKNSCLKTPEKSEENIQVNLKTNQTPLKIIKKEPPPFNKGNAEVYPTLNELENFLKYYKNGYHILDCILNYHENGCFENNENKIETNEVQGHFAYKKDYARSKKGGLNYLNSDLMIQQKKVIISLLKQAGSNLIHGRGLINITLPVEIFEPRSFLERLARSFGHAPVFLEKAGMTNNILEQMKYTIAFFLSSMVLCIQQEKPFNPILGETFQGRIKGSPIYLEQLSHHPPITYYYMIGKNYKLYGSHEPIANLTANTCVAQQKGSPVAHFLNNNSKICFRWPLFIINGTAMGQRCFNFFSKAIAYEKENNYLCEILFNVNEVSGLKGLFQRKDYFLDEIGGAIYKVKPDVIARYENSKKPYKLELNHEQDVVETISKIKGEWTSNIQFDGNRYWDIERDRPFVTEYEQNCLPSDSNFRDDVLYLRMGNKEESQSKKNEGENSQRYEKKLRENNKKKIGKNKKK